MKAIRTAYKRLVAIALVTCAFEAVRRVNAVRRVVMGLTSIVEGRNARKVGG